MSPTPERSNPTQRVGFCSQVLLCPGQSHIVFITRTASDMTARMLLSPALGAINSSLFQPASGLAALGSALVSAVQYNPFGWCKPSLQPWTLERDLPFLPTWFCRVGASRLLLRPTYSKRTYALGLFVAMRWNPTGQVHILPSYSSLTSPLPPLPPTGMQQGTSCPTVASWSTSPSRIQSRKSPWSPAASTLWSALTGTPATWNCSQLVASHPYPAS